MKRDGKKGRILVPQRAHFLAELLCISRFGKMEGQIRIKKLRDFRKFLKFLTFSRFLEMLFFAIFEKWFFEKMQKKGVCQMRSLIRKLSDYHEHNPL